MAYKERGNGQGSVTTLKDSKGKKKYQVRVTVGSKFDVEKERVIYTSKSLGVFKTKAEAEAVLAEYNSSPYDLTTTDQLYQFMCQIPQYMSKEAQKNIQSSGELLRVLESLITNMKIEK